MESRLILATADGVLLGSLAGSEWQATSRRMPGEQVTSVIAREGVILVGTTRGVHRSDDLGESWRPTNNGLDTRHVRWMAYHPDISDFEFAGVEPAGIYYSRNGGESWQACPEVAAMRDRFGWYLPYSPAAGCVRGFGFHGSRAYAAVEVGGLLVSNNGGETWELVKGSPGNPHISSLPYLNPDVHSVAVHPSSADLVFTPTGGGLYRSNDGGGSWTLLYPCYCRAVWVDPADPDRIVLGGADSVDRNGRIEASQDGGRTWQAASQPLAVPWRRHMVERFYQAGDELLAVLSNGELLASPSDRMDWWPVMPGVTGINAVTTMT